MSAVLGRDSNIVPRWDLGLRQRGKALAWSLGVLYAIAIIGLWAVYRIEDTVVLNVGNSYARPYLHRFLTDEHNDQIDYTYTTSGSALVLPGLGSGQYRVRLGVSGWRPPPYTTPALTLRSGSFVTTFPLRHINHVVAYELIFPPTLGDLSIGFDSDLYTPSPDDPRMLGVALDWVEVQRLGSLPPLTTTALLLALVTLFWWFWLRVGLSAPNAALLTSVLLLSLLAGLLQARILITVGLSRWVIALLLLHLLLWPLQRIVRGGIERYNLEVSPAAWSWLWAIFGMALLFKLGGMLYPHGIFFDEAAHTKRVDMLLRGRFMELYQPGYTSYMGVTVGLEGGFMPYSPLWYLIIAPLRMIGIPIGDAMNGLSAILDATKGLMIFVITQATLRRQRAALLASGIYQLLPMPYFLLSWGNYPTQFGLWASLLAITYLALHYQQMQVIRQWRPFTVWVALLALAILSYTMIGVIAFTMFGILIVIKAAQGFKMNRHLIYALVAGMLLAEALAFSVYHVQFVPIITQTTIPSVVERITQKVSDDPRTEVEPQGTPLTSFVANVSFLRNHSTDPLLMLALIGLVWLYIDSRG
ncbi:MAG: hypothetical protein HGB28_06175, partial [Oscillochloris sp.]|nr:hypothetical protein [Oscillochloris sp.]